LEGRRRRKRESKLERKYQSISTSFMSVEKSTYKYEKYEMAIDRAHNNVVISISLFALRSSNVRYVFVFSPLFELLSKSLNYK